MSRELLKFDLGNKVIFPGPDRTRSSVVEHCLHTAGVTGSNPVASTK